jgi:arylsulfatase
LLVRPEDEARYAGKVKQPNQAKFFGMVANIDDNVGRLLAKLKELGVENDTLVIYMNDNGGTAGVPVHNAGMRGAKGSPWLGGIRAASFWRWPGALKPGDRDQLAGNIDFLPTVAEIAGAKLTDEAKAQVEGRSLVPLLKDAKAEWPDRKLFTHVGRWPKGADPNGHWQMVNDSKGGKKGWELFDLVADPGEKQDVAGQHPQVVKELNAAYDQWWASVQPMLVNEAAVGPKINSFAELYWQQYAGPGPNNVPPPKADGKR